MRRARPDDREIRCRHAVQWTKPLTVSPMNIDQTEVHNVSTLARRLLTSRASVGRMLAFGKLKAARESNVGSFYAKADLDRLREHEVAALREKCSKLTGSEREKLT